MSTGTQCVSVLPHSRVTVRGSGRLSMEVVEVVEKLIASASRGTEIGALEDAPPDQHGPQDLVEMASEVVDSVSLDEHRAAGEPGQIGSR